MNDDHDLGAEYARQRADADASLGRIFRNASELAACWEGCSDETSVLTTPKRGNVARGRDPARVPERAGWTSGDEMLRGFINLAQRRPVVASVLALTAGAVAVYAMKLASEQA